MTTWLVKNGADPTIQGTVSIVLNVEVVYICVHILINAHVNLFYNITCSLSVM